MREKVDTARDAVNDIWIAAATLDCGGTLLIVDRDFARVPGLDQITLDAV